MVKFLNKTAGILLALMLVTLFLPPKAYAAEVIRADRPVSLAVSCSYAEKGLSGVSCRLYKVADFSENGIFTVAETFKAYSIVPDQQAVDTRMAVTLASYVQRDSITPYDTGTTDRNGQLTFPSDGKKMLPGYYLLVAEPFTKDGFTYKISPLLICLPNYEESDHALNYDVTIHAKSERAKGVSPNTPPVIPTQPEPPASVVPKVSDKELPQTGLLWQPALVLVSVGLTAVLIGAKLKKKVFESDGRRSPITPFHAFGVVCLSASALLICYNLAQDLGGYIGAKQNAERLALHIEEAQENQNGTVVQTTCIIDPDTPMPEVESDGNMYIGLLQIDALSLELPVISRWSYGALKTAPARYTGSVYQNNMVIAAHNYSGHFGRLKNLQRGDTVRFTDMEGNEFLYQVAAVDIVAPTEIHEMISGDWDMTLFTCTAGGSSRVAVRCNRIGV